MDSATAPRLDAKLLYRRLDSLFGALDPELPPRRLMESFLEDAFETLRGDLRLHAGVLYCEGRDGFSLLKTVGRLDRPATAAVVVGVRPKRYVLLFLLLDGWEREVLDFTLNTIRAALGSRLMEERALGSLEQAAEIQQSLLLDEPPPFAGYELAARSRPAEEVGGDFFDFAVFDEDML